MIPVLSQKLAEFRLGKQVLSKGKLATVLFLTRLVGEDGLPYPLGKLRTAKQGQVAGLGRDAVQKILDDHGIKRVLAEEGGRTSRGSLGLAEDYIAFLNEAHNAQALKQAHLREIESWWVGHVRDLFNRQSFKINLDPSLTIGSLVSGLFEAARKRQDEMEGLRIEGAVLHYLVAAKLRLVFSELNMTVRGFSVADDPTASKGDFIIGETIFHVTTAPTEKLFEKCKTNLTEGHRPLIVCPKEEVAAARSMANRANLSERVEIYDVGMFVSTNLNERGKFEAKKIQQSARDLILAYNRIIDEIEVDYSLKIELR